MRSFFAAASVRGLLVTLCAAATLVVAGCGATEAPSVDATPGPHGVPVPATAERAETFDGWRAPGMSGDALVAWYEERLPEGEDFGDWRWCELNRRENTHQWLYEQPERRILTVVVTHTDDPPGILIGSDQSGPC